MEKNPLEKIVGRQVKIFLNKDTPSSPTYKGVVFAIAGLNLIFLVNVQTRFNSSWAPADDTIINLSSSSLICVQLSDQFE